MNKGNNDFYIYCHIFPNGKRYIGTSHQKPNRRYRKGNGYKGQVVYDAINEFGWDNIEHIVLEDGLSWQETLQREKDYILQFKTNEDEFGYNISIGQQPPENIKRIYYKTLGMTGKHHSQESKKKMRIAKLGRKMEEETIIKKSKPVIQFDINMNIINEYYGISEASRKTNTNLCNISQCCKGKRKTANGYIWKFKGGDKLCNV